MKVNIHIRVRVQSLTGSEVDNMKLIFTIITAAGGLIFLLIGLALAVIIVLSIIQSIREWR